MNSEGPTEKEKCSTKMDLFLKEFSTKADPLSASLDIQMVIHMKATWVNSSPTAKVCGNKKTVLLKDSSKTASSSTAPSHTLINQNIQDKWSTTRSAAKTVNSSMQMDRNLQENSKITNCSKVLSRKKMALPIRGPLKMVWNMERESTPWKVFYNMKDSLKTMSSMV